VTPRENQVDVQDEVGIPLRQDATIRSVFRGVMAACAVASVVLSGNTACVHRSPVPHAHACPEGSEISETRSASEVPMEPGRSSANDPAGFREVFPHVRVDVAAGHVEFDSVVCIDAHNPRMPRVYLEVLACAPDTREHESLVMTRAKPSHVHAALLLLGLEPGKPGQWDWQGDRIRAIPPEGPAVRVDMIVAGREPEAIESWVVNSRDGRGLREVHSDARFVFAGSQAIPGREVGYRADGEGCVVGLATFGGEVIAWSGMIHHDSQIEEPQWIADGAKVPAFGTPVVVRISRVER
jgi:hypothetical protein